MFYFVLLPFMRSFIARTLHRLLLGLSNQRGEVEGAYITRGNGEKCVENSSRKTWRE